MRGESNSSQVCLHKDIILYDVSGPACPPVIDYVDAEVSVYDHVLRVEISVHRPATGRKLWKVEDLSYDHARVRPLLAEKSCHRLMSEQCPWYRRRRVFKASQ